MYDGERYFYNIQTEEDIERCQSLAQDRDFICFIRLTVNNTYRFSPWNSNQSRLIYILGEKFITVKQRLHAYNLFHNSIMKGSCLWLNIYYQRNIDYLSGKTDLLPTSQHLKLIDFYRGQVDFVLNLLSSKSDLSHKRIIRSLAADKSILSSARQRRKVLITGWYGTETAGDKAILLEIINYYNNKYNGKIDFGITSINEGLSLLTNMELELDAEIVVLNSISSATITDFDSVVFGGGPLMDSSQLKYIAPLFEWANRTKRDAVIFGCGYGPVKTPRGQEFINVILANSNKGFFRDELSLTNAKKNGWTAGDFFACDPALKYVMDYKTKRVNDVNTDKICYAMLRKQTGEYSNRPKEESDGLNSVLIGLFDYLYRQHSLATSLIPMHVFWYGNDDREYFQELRKATAEPQLINFSNEPILLDEILDTLAVAKLGLPMRFHAHVFLLGLGKPFLSLNYTGSGGKIDELLKRFDLSQTSISLGEVNGEKLVKTLEYVLNNTDEITARMLTGVQSDLVKLESVYDMIDL